MAENNNSKKSLKQILSETLAQDMVDNPPSSFSYQDFEKLLEKNKVEVPVEIEEKKTSKAAAREKSKDRVFHRYAYIAAAFLLILAGVLIAVNAFSTDVGANKNPTEEIITEDGIVIEDGGYGSSGNEDWVITNWEEVYNAKATLPTLTIPEYLPEGYHFEKLLIYRTDTGFANFEYYFENYTSKIVKIIFHTQNSGEVSVDISNASVEATSKYGNVYINEMTEPKIATILIDDGLIMYVCANISSEEIVKIIDNIKF